jgi:intracellular sulfur oxidation DsrE/DsrF family protein
MSSTPSRVNERRRFLSRFAAGAAVVGGLLRGDSANAQSARAEEWQPARHAKDDWLEQLPGRHRFIIDSITPLGFGSALLFANNFFLANQNGYGLGDNDAAVVIVARHFSTCFAFTDPMWRKYGAAIGDAAGGFDDPKIKMRPSSNVYMSATHQSLLPNYGVTLDSLVARGVHFAVCEMATRRFAGAIATATKGDADAIFKELSSNLIRNTHLVTAGIVAVNRAQERGYTFATAM